MGYLGRPLVKECVTEKYISYFSTKTYVVGIQKNRLSEKHMLWVLKRTATVRRFF